jgi:hypothetical protein
MRFHAIFRLLLPIHIGRVFLDCDIHVGFHGALYKSVWMQAQSPSLE